jgi:hypothetical protein
VSADAIAVSRTAKVAMKVAMKAERRRMTSL